MNKLIIILYLISIGLILYYDTRILYATSILHIWILVIAWNKPKREKTKDMGELLAEYLGAHKKHK